jgi:hypothetical protein
MAKAPKKNPKHYVVMHYDAGHTRAGNPQRVFAIYDIRTASLVHVIDEGYGGGNGGTSFAEWAGFVYSGGTAAQLERARAWRARLMGGAEITKAEYRRLLDFHSVSPS